MSITKAAPAPDVQLTPSTAARKVGAVASALFAVALFMTVAAVDVPHDATDAELLQWWQQSGNRMSGLVSGISAICAAVLIAVVMNYIRSLGATAKAPQWLAFARSMGAAVTAVWLVTGAARAVIAHLVDVMDEPLPGTDVLRFATAFNYTLLGQVRHVRAGAGHSCRVGRGAAHRRARSVGRLRRLVCGVIMLAAVVALYGGLATPVAILWALSLAVAIWRQPHELRTRHPRPTNGILVAITVIVATFASSGRLGHVHEPRAPPRRRPSAARAACCRRPGSTPRRHGSVISVAALPMSIWPQAMSYARPSSDVDLVSPVIACLVAV